MQPAANSSGEWTEHDYSAVLEQLDAHERDLITIGERLDGAGFWAAAAGVMRSSEKVNELARAVENQLRRR